MSSIISAELIEYIDNYHRRSYEFNMTESVAKKYEDACAAIEQAFDEREMYRLAVERAWRVYRSGGTYSPDGYVVEDPLDRLIAKGHATAIEAIRAALAKEPK